MAAASFAQVSLMEVSGPSWGSVHRAGRGTYLFGGALRLSAACMHTATHDPGFAPLGCTHRHGHAGWVSSDGDGDSDSDSDSDGDSDSEQW